MDSFLFFFAGSLVSWLVTMVYYRKSSVKAPDWAKEMIERLPKEPPKDIDLVKIFEEALKNTSIDGGTF